MFNLKGKVALITGSTRGIGKAIAISMADAGADVVVSSRNIGDCEDIAREINERDTPNQGRAIAIACNISHRDQLENIVTQTQKQLGKIDILVLNAAVNPHLGSMSTIPDKALDKILSVNIKSNHWLCQLVLPEMVERKEGSITIISSIAALVGQRDLGAYGLSKAADLALIRNLAVEYGGDNIRANAIAPGLIKTEFARMLWENKTLLEDTIYRTPLNRIGEPDDIAGTAVFLASKAAKFITGQTITIDGGSSAN
ncbi:MAG: SDR family oxidoreductase [Pseudomonadales bacterium]|nr:SDR family oxidoreductase [Pseudomonadales bacterium]